MNESRDSILERIKKLYTELFLSSLHDRIDSYHTNSDTEHHHRVSDALHKLIDKTSEHAHEVHSVKAEKGSQYHTEGATSSAKSSKIHDHKTSIFSMTMNGLSMYFKKHKRHEHDPEMTEKLQRCVWDHVHSAHRYARTGDASSAKLHANIATSAMKTLSHYMEDEEYSDFCGEVHEQLDQDTSSKSKST